MDYYKKKNIKFNSQVRREIRYAETVKARESSRFKRLSMLRCIEDEEVEQLAREKPKEKVSEEVKKPVSRLEILRKWKQEKLIKQQLEKKNSLRPFYAGAPSLIDPIIQGALKRGKRDQPSGDMSSISKVSSCSSLQTSRIPNSSKQVSSTGTLTSRIQNSSKPLGAIAKATKSTQPQLVRLPNFNKEPSSKKTTEFGSNPKTNLLKSKIQTGIYSPASSLNRSNSCTIPKLKKNTQPYLGRIPNSNQESKKTTVFGNNPKTNQVVPKSKIQTGISSPASSLKESNSIKGFQSRIGKPASLVPRIPVQRKLPVSNNQKPIAAVNKKLTSVPSVGKRLPALSSSQKSAPGVIKKPGSVSKVDMKKVPPGVGNQKPNKASPESTANKEPSDVEVIAEEKDVGRACSVDYKPESGSERNIEGLAEIFDCDVSIIKRAPSFAPEDFKFRFQPPTELLDLSFDFSILKKIKAFTSRTSTPSKQGTKSDDNDKAIIEKPSENVEIETDIPNSSKPLDQSSVNDKDDKKILQTETAFENEDVETNISNLSEHDIEVYKSDKEDKNLMQEPSENGNIEDISTPLKRDVEVYESDKDCNDIMQKPSENGDIEDISTSSKQYAEVYKSDKDDKDSMHEPSENVDNKLISKQDQEAKDDEDDNEIMQRSSENVKIVINNSSPSKNLVKDSGSSPPKSDLQNSYNLSQPACHNSVAADEELLLKDCERVVAETEKCLDLPLNGEQEREKSKEKFKDSFKSTYQKRRSMLKKSILNSIAEADDNPLESPAVDASENNPSPFLVDAAENKENVLCKVDRRSRRVSELISIEESSSTPRRCHRISKLISIDESPATTPRRSLRLLEKVSKNNQLDNSKRQGSSHTDLTNDFEQLTLEDFDKMNPDDYLYDPFDDSPESIKSKKISLLYSPDKRKSIRRSIRGDLMSFSPIKSPRV